LAITNYADLKKDLKRRMDSAVDVLKKEFQGLRTGRASSALLDPVMVDAYGSLVPLNQVANVSVPEPRMITVQVWDKGTLKAVEKAIRDAGLGLNPAADGQTVRVPIPPLTPDQVGALLDRYASGAGVDPAGLHRRTGGNLFYLVELVRFYQGRATVGEEVPTSVQAVVEQRHDQLPDDTRRVLRLAALQQAAVQAGHDPAIRCPAQSY